jgi:hypothetical protein
MPIRNQNWYNANESRRYPLDDQSNGRDDAGLEIVDSVLVDCDIRFSSLLGNLLYVQGITVSRGLVSVVFGIADDLLQTTGRTVAAVTVQRPITKYRHYDITPLVDGIDGWVVFGAGVDEEISLRFATPAQTFISVRCADNYAPLPIPSIKKTGVGSALSDIVTFDGLDPVVITHEKIKPDPDSEEEVDVLMFRLNTQQITSTYNPLSEFIGPCSGRPDSGTCGKDPIEFINGVEPDCDGNIVIEFNEPLVAATLADCAGIGVDVEIGLNELCNALAPKKPQEFVDKCCAILDSGGNQIPQDSILVFSTFIAFPATGVSGKAYLAFDTNLIYRWNNNTSSYVQAVSKPIDPFCWPKIENIDPDIITDIDLNLTQYACIDVPACVDFTHCDTNNTLFVVETGAADREETVAPPPCPYCDGTPQAAGNHGVLNTNSSGVATVYAIKKCRTNWFSGVSFYTEMQLPFVDSSYERIGGLVFNYYYMQDNFRVMTRYFAVTLNRDNNSVQVWGYTGNEFVNLSTVYVQLGSFVDGDWFGLTASVSQAGTNAGVLTWTLVSVPSPVDGSTAVGAQIATGFTTVPAMYFTKYGLHGLYARRSFVNFNKLQVS